MTDADIVQSAIHDQALPIGTVLCGDQFTIDGHLGAGGFGITYRATDNVLGRDVVIKECFPRDFCYRDGRDAVARSRAFGQPIHSIVKMFMREARSLAKLRHPNIVGVHRIFEENGTAYMVIDMIEGRDLFGIIESRSPPLSPGRVRDILLQLLDAIEKVHEVDLLHRDISPDNILIEPSGRPVLIDFGAARGDASRHTRAVSSLMVVKDGYSPQEFYVAGSQQAPCSDLYALAATFYHVLSGKAPPDSQTRMLEIAGNKPDPCVPLAGRIDGYDEEFLKAIDMAMRIHPGDRLQSAAKWRSMIEADQSAAAGAAPRPSSKDLSLDLELSLTQLVAETNDEVRRTSQSPALPQPVSKPREEPAKPAWVEEFNRESLAAEIEAKARAQAEARARAEEEARAKAEAEAMLEAEAEEEQPAAAGNDWVSRARDKQNSKLNAQAEAFGIFAPEKSERATSVTTEPHADDTTEMAAAATASPPRSHRSLGLLVGLLLCVFVLIYLEAA